MLRGRDFEHALSKTIEYGGKAAYTAGRFILPLIL